jgi:hypothetical protein
MNKISLEENKKYLIGKKFIIINIKNGITKKASQ